MLALFCRSAVERRSSQCEPGCRVRTPGSTHRFWSEAATSHRGCANWYRGSRSTRSYVCAGKGFWGGRSEEAREYAEATEGCTQVDVGGVISIGLEIAGRVLHLKARRIFSIIYMLNILILAYVLGFLPATPYTSLRTRRLAFYDHQ